MTGLVLFRRDLRLADNAALSAAVREYGTVLPVYIHESRSDYSWAPGGASRWWLHHSLSRLDERLADLGGRLNVYRGEALPVLLELIEQHKISGVYWNRRYDPADASQDAGLKQALGAHGVPVQSFPGALWHEPPRLSTKSGEPYRVFTPFWRNLRGQIGAASPSPAPKAQRWLGSPRSLPLSALGLLPRIAWAQGLHGRWEPGEVGAHRALGRFLEGALPRYAADRDIPGIPGTSSLSPHLHFGEITPRQIHHALQLRADDRRAKDPVDIEPYLRQLGWREFGHHLLFHFPKTSEENFNPRFDSFRWAPEDGEALERWQRGMTGIPLVDAGMRELWQTGWMHNRVRMVAASFLTKNLRQHWLQGARWFWDTLVDADLANNSLGWQWVAGSGADAAPYFRVFNPTAQARRFDPGGAYIRRWIPELESFPDEHLYEPWRYERAAAKMRYPGPLMDLSASRQLALEAYQATRR